MLTFGVGAASGQEQLVGDLDRLRDRAVPRGSVSQTWTGGVPASVFASLEHLGGLETNWDFDGAPGISPATQEHAAKLVFRLYCASETLRVPIPDPHLFASSDGMIGLFWKNESKGVDLEVLIGDDSVEAVGSERGEVYEYKVDLDEVLDVLALVHKRIVSA